MHQHMKEFNLHKNSFHHLFYQEYIVHEIIIIIAYALLHHYYTNMLILKATTNLYLKLRNLNLVPKMLILIMTSLFYPEKTLME